MPRAAGLAATGLVVGVLVVGLVPAAMGVSAASAQGGAGEYSYVCEDGGVGLHLVDVLEATGEHKTFLDLMQRYDPEGLAILADVVLADKTVWAPTDAAFAALGDTLASLSDAEVKEVLGFHISPPRRTPGGDYPIVTPQLLLDAGEMEHRTRTGVLTGSDQRTRTTSDGGVLRIEGITVGSTARCAEAGSVLAIDGVITDVTPPSRPVWLWNRLVRILLYDDIRFVIYATVPAVVIGPLIGGVARRRRRTS
jgi:uncharacterized surface protein with fasciclin (FAS1) repeats